MTRRLYVATQGGFTHQEFILPVLGANLVALVPSFFPAQDHATAMAGQQYPQFSLGVLSLRWEQRGDIFFSTPLFHSVHFGEPVLSGPLQWGEEFSLSGTRAVVIGLDYQLKGRRLMISFTDHLNQNLNLAETYSIFLTLVYREP